ncbi:DUF262 domain-containing protein [Helicobacter pullorum]|uniref:DUF262 domain-containing protein n=2 Tax=Helicobacter pullorum TaxID=35818 RepID=UPI00098179EC|nr:DUF262 domain-containing protein [Helicobacter pullorum]
MDLKTDTNSHTTNQEYHKQDQTIELEGEETLDPSLQEYDSIYPLSNIRIEKSRMSLYEIKRRIERKDIETAPDFQRESVWRQKQKSELIESVLMGIPIPVFYFFEKKDGKIQIVDGKQRISTFMDFMNDQFDLKQLNIIKSIRGKKFSSLELIQQRKIEDYQIDAYIIQPPTPEQVKFNIFDRINRGGTSLNNQEMRNALYQGRSTELINKLSQEQAFKKATANSIPSKRMKDRYIILRFIGFYMYFSKINCDFKYEGNIDEFLSKVMVFLNGTNDTYLCSELELLFKKVMNFAHTQYGEDIFRFNNPNGSNKRPINMALFESLSYFFALCIDHNKTPTKEDVDRLKGIFDKSGKFIRGIDSVASVEYRFMEIRKFLKDEYVYKS